MTKVGFIFPSDESGQWDGFNDPGIEHFAGNRLQHLGREVTQNTLDAKQAKPVRIQVQLISVKVSDLPDHANLARAVRRCAKAAKKDEDTKAIKFFDKASELLDAKAISVLQIRDSNTTGLTGPCEHGKPFFAMLKATGHSQKSGTSAGSYGIGKFAPFAVSELRTVFVSTVWFDGKKPQHYVQGKAVLMSHHDEKGQPRRGTGFWGYRDGCKPVTSLLKVEPKWLKMPKTKGRLECGTMLSIVGFTRLKDWQKILAAKIVENFFGAISRGELEVEIKNGPTITAGRIGALLSDKALRASIIDQSSDTPLFDRASHYLSALDEGPEVHVEKTENYYLGRCELRILVGENLPKRVAVLRNGMFITDSLPGLKRFSDFKEFAAVLECKADKGLSLLREMEPPRHDAFEPDRLPPDRRSEGRVALRELSEWVRKMLHRHARDPVQEETNVDELADYFGDEDEEGAGERREENPSGGIVVRARPMKARPAPGSSAPGNSGAGDDPGDDPEGDSGGSGATGGGRGASAGGSNTGGRGASDSSQQPPILSGLPLSDVRAVPLSATRRRVAFTPPKTGKLVIEVQDSGADKNYALSVVGASFGRVERGRITEVAARAGERLVLEIELEKSFHGTLRVVADAV